MRVSISKNRKNAKNERLDEEVREIELKMDKEKRRRKTRVLEGIERK